MDIIRTCCLVCGNVPPQNLAGDSVIKVVDESGKVLAHLVLIRGRDGYMLTDECNYRPWFMKCVCSEECGKTLVERYNRNSVVLLVLLAA